MQEFAWRRAEFALLPRNIPPPTPLLSSPHRVKLDWQDWDAAYQMGPPVNVAESPRLTQLLEFHRQATVNSALVGHDWGNVTAYVNGVNHAAIFGMNRLNHAPPMFFEAMRRGDRSLMESALAWCDNFYDLTIWWGPQKYGGTRYNNIRAGDNPTPDDDTTFMWRGDKSITFCTKGYDSFLLAYEQTGDPRMREALEAQLAYAAEYVHTNDGECRNIGDVLDFVRLLELTGEKRHLDQATRLFRELRPALSPDYLFDQGGKSIAAGGSIH